MGGCFAATLTAQYLALCSIFGATFKAFRLRLRDYDGL